MALRPFRFSKPVHSTSYATPPKLLFGGAEIRTLGGLTPTTVFKTAALDHSATPPNLKQEKLSKNSKKYIPEYIKGDIAEIDK